MRRKVITLLGSGVRGLAVAACALMFLAGASCKKESKAGDTNPGDVVNAADKAKDPHDHGKKKPVIQPEPKDLDTSPLTGVDVSKLEDKQQRLFYKLIASFSSPCGKAHSLRTSVTTDTACKRAPFSARYLKSMIEDEISEEDIITLWEAKYKTEAAQHKFDLSDVPHSGPIDAPVQIVEFFDYGCPACQAFRPVMDEVVAQNANTAVVYYMMFPLTDAHPDSMSAAQAAIAAHRQGKFKAMHDVLFDKSPAHKRSAVMGYARDLGLNMAKFEVDYDGAEETVRKQMKQGNGAGVEGTPSIFFNGRTYEGPAHPKYFGYWIEEDLAVNR